MDDLEKLWQSPTLDTDCVSMHQVIGGNAYLVYYATAPNTQMVSVANALGLRRGNLVINPPHVSAQLTGDQASIHAAGHILWRPRPVDTVWTTAATQHGQVILILCEEPIPADPPHTHARSIQDVARAHPAQT